MKYHRVYTFCCGKVNLQGQQCILTCTPFKYIMDNTILTAYIYIISLVALHESNMSSCLHFSMQKIEISCDLDRACRRSNVNVTDLRLLCPPVARSGFNQIASTSANNLLCLSTFALRNSRIATTLCTRVSFPGCSTPSVTNTIFYFIRITDGVGWKIIK